VSCTLRVVSAPGRVSKVHTTEGGNQLLLFFLFRKVAPKLAKPTPKKLNPWDEANLLQNMKQENVHITTVAQQRYVYRESAAGTARGVHALRERQRGR
jgi:hypothetical protein